MTSTAETSAALAKLKAPAEHRTFQDLLVRMAPEIEKALPRAIGSERFARRKSQAGMAGWSRLKPGALVCF